MRASLRTMRSRIERVLKLSKTSRKHANLNAIKHDRACQKKGRHRGGFREASRPLHTRDSAAPDRAEFLTSLPYHSPQARPSHLADLSRCRYCIMSNAIPDHSGADAHEFARVEVGRLEVITGPMFSGKSEELIRRLKRARIARQRVACFKPDIDLRYHRTAIASHSSQTHEATTVANTSHLRQALYPQIPTVEVVGIDEAQFFDEAIVQFALELVHLGKRVVMAGLDTTFTGDPFGPIPALMAVSDEVTKLSAVCMVCGAPAIHTQRIGKSRELVVVGAAGMYEARCRTCFRPYLDTSESEQLELPEMQDEAAAR